MSVTRVVSLIGALSAFSGACFCQSTQIFTGIDFEQLASRTGCIRNAPLPSPGVPVAPATAVPALNLPGVTISGGQVVSYVDPVQTTNNVYYTLNTCAGVQPSITITFDAPASDVSLVIGQNWASIENIQVQDDGGDNLSVPVTNNPFGQSLFLTGNNIHTLTLSLPAGYLDPRFARRILYRQSAMPAQRVAVFRRPHARLDDRHGHRH